MIREMLVHGALWVPASSMNAMKGEVRTLGLLVPPEICGWKCEGNGAGTPRDAGGGENPRLGERRYGGRGGAQPEVAGIQE